MTDKPENKTEAQKQQAHLTESAADCSNILDKLQRFDPFIHGGEIMSGGLIGKESIKGDL